MSKRIRKFLGLPKRAKGQGDHPTSIHVSGQSTPISHSSSEPTVNRRFGDQPTPDPRPSGQSTPKPSIDHGVYDPYAGGQPILEATSSGQSIDNGIYIITNVKHGTLVFLPDPNHRTPLQGHFRRYKPGELWNVKERVRERYSIRSVSHESFANSGSRAQVKDFVEGDNTEQLWRIQERSKGKYTISTTDTRVCWALYQEEPETPVELHGAHGDPRCWWTFTKLGNDEHTETAIISDALEASLKPLQGGAGTVTLRQINHPSTAKDVQGELEKQREYLDRARDNEESRVLERLKPVDAPSYHEDRCCMKETRKHILDHIVAWTETPLERNSPPNGSTDKNIFWLYGSPGLGKTSVANSLCYRLHTAGKLGGSFFCRKGDPILGDPNRVLPNLIYKLAWMWVPYRERIVQALRDDPNLNPDWIGCELLLKNLRSLHDHPPTPLVLVMDALDESGEPQTRKTLLKGLLETLPCIDWLRFIVTSRPEHDISSLFQKLGVLGRDLATDTEAHQDIRIFTRDRMASLANDYHLSTDWPGNARLEQIATRSGGLFIFVETLYRFLDDPDPELLLTQVLSGTLGEADAELHQLYSTAIETRIGRNRESFRLFIQALVAVSTRRSLPDKTLASLIGLEPRVVSSWVDNLSSLLYRDVSENGGIRVRHLSVIEFLTGPTCPLEFQVDLQRANGQIGHRCLITMANELRFNICELETSCVLNADIPDLANRVRDKISDALLYSSMHWSSHLCSGSAPAPIEVSQLLYTFLNGRQQLYWLEVLSLMGKVPIAIAALRLMKVHFKIFEDRHQHLVENAIRFLLAFLTPISTSTPHIYISALPFMPTESDVWKDASVAFSEMIDVRKGRAKYWPAPSSLWIGHTNSVRSIAYSPDGLNVVSGSRDNTIRIWDVQTGAMVGQPIIGHTEAVWSVAYSPDGRNFVSGSLDSTIRIWDALTGVAAEQPLIGHTEGVLCVAYSPDGQSIVSLSLDKTIRIWDVQTGVAMGQPLTGHIDYVRSVAYSPDGHNIVSGSDDQTIRIWDVQTGATVGQPLRGHTRAILSVAYSPDGQNIVSGSRDNTIRIWNIHTGVVVGQPLTGHAGWVKCVVYSPDGQNIVSGSSDNTIRIWDAQTGAAVGQPLIGHTQAVWSVAYSPVSRNVVSGSDDTTVRIWDTRTGAAVVQPPTGHTEGVLCVAYSPDGLSVASVSLDKTIRVWDVHTGAAVGQSLTGHSDYPRSVSYSPDGQNIVSGSDDKTIRIWDAQTRAAVGRPFEGHTGAVWSVAYSPDGQSVVSGSSDTTIRIWGVHTGAAVGQPLTGHTGGILSVSYSPNGQNVVSGSSDNTIRVWDVHTGAVVGQPLTGHTGWVKSVAYSPDGHNIASGSDDKTIRIWDVQAGVAVGQPLTGHSDYLRSVAYSPDGRNILSGSDDKTIRIWDVKTGVAVGQPLRGHTWWVNSVAYSPDGQNVVSGSLDSTIRIWNVRAGINEDVHGVLSPSSHPFTNHLPLTTFSGRHIPGILLDPLGWVRSTEGLLFWVPEDCRNGLTSPAIMTIAHMSHQRPVRIDFTRFQCGTSWINIRGGIRAVDLSSSSSL